MEGCCHRGQNIAHFELISFQNRKTIEEFATGSIAHILPTSNKTAAYLEVIPGDNPGWWGYAACLQKPLPCFRPNYVVSLP